MIADILSRLPFATAELNQETVSASGALSLSGPNLDDKASARSHSAVANLDLLNVNLEPYRSESEAELSDSDSDTSVESFSGSDIEVVVFESENVNADACNVLQTSTPFVDLPISREGLEPEDFSIPTREELAQDQEADMDLKRLRDYVQTQHCTTTDELAPFSGRLKTLAQLLDQISVRDGVLVFHRNDDPQRELTIVPEACVERVIRFYHEGPGAAHQATKATSAKIIRSFWWPNLKLDVRLYIACCTTCEKFIQLNRTPKAGLKSIDVGGRGDCVAMDIVGGMDSLPTTPRGNRYILTIIDCFTRFAVALPLVDQSAEVLIASVLGSWITVYGTPRRILTDQGRNFESDQFAQFCNLFRISKIRTTAYHPQSNGICERFNQTLKHSLAKILSKEQQTSWDLYLGFRCFLTIFLSTQVRVSPRFTSRSAQRLGCHPTSFSACRRFHGVKGYSRLSEPTSSPLSLLLKSFSVLMRAFATVRENLRSFH